jgi:hypothetical protein
MTQSINVVSDHKSILYTQVPIVCTTGVLCTVIDNCKYTDVYV